MKRLVLIIFIVFLILCTTIVPFAHSGGTDGKGGHTNQTTGDYHYHHGYPAHDHPNGVCPYATQCSSGSNSGGSDSDSKLMWFFIGLGGLAVVFILSNWIIDRLDGKLSEILIIISGFISLISLGLVVVNGLLLLLGLFA